MDQGTREPSVPGGFLSDMAHSFCAGDPFARRLFRAGPERVRLAQGQALFRQGDPGGCMYLLLAGRLGVCLEHAGGEETTLAQLEPGAPVGEMALLTGQPRTASVYALTDAELLCCSRSTYERLAAEHPDELGGFTSLVTRRLQEVQLTAVLSSFFGVHDSQTLAWLRGELEWQSLDHGAVLFRQGDPGEAMYLVVSGRLRISATLPDEGQRHVGEVSPGESVGEMALLSGEPRSATAEAIRETNVVKMSLPVFQQLAERHPDAVLRLARLVIERQQRSLRVSPRTHVRALALALVSATPGAPMAAFAERLARSLAVHGSVLMLDSERLDARLGRSDAAQAKTHDPTGFVVSAWLSEQEGQHQYLLYVADQEWSPWTERCICQADRLLLLADAQADPAPGLIEARIALRKLPVRQELILLHPPQTRQPTNTSAWLDKRSIQTHHHVRPGDEAHMRRLARRLAGHATGMVLSGGGARGFAHVGVLRAMEEHGIEIDLIGGTSMGSLVGGVYAIDKQIAECVALAERFANPRRLFDYTLPVTSLMASKKVTGVIRDLLGEVRIEDLWRPFFCVSSNLTRAQAVIHRTGPLWHAVRASIAIPGIFTPMLQDDDVLVDGGALNNFPVDIMVELCEGGTVFGSSVCPRLENGPRYDFGHSINGWRVLWSRLNPFRPAMRVPSLLGSLMRAQEIRGVSGMRHSESLVDVMIRPDVGCYSILDFASYEPIIEIGYTAARERLLRWQERASSDLQADTDKHMDETACPDTAL